MSKRILLILAMTMALFVISCGDDTSDECSLGEIRCNEAKTESQVCDHGEWGVMTKCTETQVCFSEKVDGATSVKCVEKE